MKSLKEIVRIQTLMVGIVPVLLISLATLVIVVRHGIVGSMREAQSLAAREVGTLDQASLLMEDRWRTILATADVQDAGFSNEVLRRWVSVDSGICLMSVWKDDSLVFSHPRRDESRILLWSDRNWTGVENNPRCDEPVVRHIVHLREDLAAVVSVRLSYLSRKLIASLPEASRKFSLVDFQGMYVGSFDAASVAEREIDPLTPRINPAVNDTTGWVVEDGRLHAYSARTLRGPPWILIARQDLFDTMRPLLPLFVVMASILVATALLGIRLARRSTRKILDPLESLRRSLDSIEAGHFESHLPTAQVQELDDLSNAYNRMSSTIQAREDSRRVELERMIGELEAFSYSVSHDLRAPLRAIEGYTRILEEDEAPNLSAEAKQHLGRIHLGTVRMSRLIEDILRLSRTSRSPLSSVAVDQDALVKDVVEGFRSELGDRKIEWRIGALGVAQGDPGLLRQVWENLISNAVKYTGNRELAVIEIGACQDRPGGCWWIRDNGAGFDPELSDKLFRTFQRLHTDQEFEGTGIGLALVRRIVEKHGGSVEGRGDIDKGATFSFRIPA